MDEDFRFMKRAEIHPDRQGPGATERYLIDNHGSHGFSKFIRLEIARDGENGGYYLFHIAADGSRTDTWHGNIEDALDAAAEEYGVSREDWRNFD
jgi:hypothetical protein